MSKLSKQDTLLASLGLATAFTLGTWFGDAVHPDKKCSSPENPATTQTIVPPEHQWQNTAKADAQPSEASDLDCTSSSPSGQRLCWPKDISPLSGPK